MYNLSEIPVNIREIQSKQVYKNNYKIHNYIFNKIGGNGTQSGLKRIQYSLENKKIMKSGSIIYFRLANLQKRQMKTAELIYSCIVKV